MTKKDTRTLILTEAFKLFSANTYEQVTYNELEDRTKLTRGAIAYYFKTKESIFQEMCDKFLLNDSSVLVKLENAISQQINLKEFIKLYVQTIVDLKKEMIQTYNIKNYNKALINITNQATYYYPNFEIKALKWQIIQCKLWKEVLVRATLSKEIKGNIDLTVLSELFEDIYCGIAYTGIVYPDGIDIDRLTKSFNLLYSMIVNEEHL